MLPRLSVPQRAAILIPLAAYPLVYYLVGFETRYREPLDGLALLLAATALGARFQPRAITVPGTEGDLRRAIGEPTTVSRGG